MSNVGQDAPKSFLPEIANPRKLSTAWCIIAFEELSSTIGLIDAGVGKFNSLQRRLWWRYKEQTAKLANDMLLADGDMKEMDRRLGLDAGAGACELLKEGASMSADDLPNQRVTWANIGSAVEEFDAWRQRKNQRYASEDAELLCYLSDQLKAEGAPLVGERMSHPVLGLLSYMSESNNRMQELMLAYLSLAVARDSGPAQKLIAGQRLHVGLDPSYVAATRCYGVQETETPEPQGGTDAAVAAIQFALDDEDGMLFLRYWNEGEFDVIRSEWPDAPEDVFIGADPLYVPG